MYAIWLQPRWNMINLVSNTIVWLPCCFRVSQKQNKFRSYFCISFQMTSKKVLWVTKGFMEKIACEGRLLLELGLTGLLAGIKKNALRPCLWIQPHYLNSANLSDIPNEMKSPTEPFVSWSLYRISPSAISGMNTISTVKLSGSSVNVCTLR